MSQSTAQPVRIPIDEEKSVSGLYQVPSNPRACFVFAHGAGAGMTHPFMSSVADGLAERGTATLRYQFLYMENHAKRPDPPKVAHAVVRAAVREAARLAPRLPLFAGGKSFGGRMTSQAQASEPLGSVRGLIFLGFPLHPAGKPSEDRAEHLFGVRIPMLFLQGTRDELAELSLIENVCARLQGANPHVSLKLFQDADHSFRVPARTGRKNADVLTDLLDTIDEWIQQQL